MVIFEGVVTKVLKNSVVAHLIDIVDDEKPDEIAEFHKKRFVDIEIQEGTVFYWVVDKKFSKFVAKKSVPLTEKESAEIKQRAEALLELFK